MVGNKGGGQKEWRKAVWSPVLYHDIPSSTLYLFYSQSTKCLQWTAKKGNRLRLARWGPGGANPNPHPNPSPNPSPSPSPSPNPNPNPTPGDIKYIKTRDLKTWSDPVTIYSQSSDGMPKVRRALLRPLG